MNTLLEQASSNKNIKSAWNNEKFFKQILQLSSIEIAIEQLGLNDEELSFIKDNIYTFLESNDIQPETVLTSYHRYNKLYEYPEFSILARRLTDRAEMYAEKFLNFDLKNFSIVLEQMWFQVYKKGMYHQMHNHSTTLISGSYYVEAPKNCAKFIVKHPIHAGLRDYPRNNDNNSLKNIRETASITPKTNMLIMFPGWIDHAVPVHNIDEHRVMISCNWHWKAK